jgi:predicted nucleic acid-binding protein
MECIGGGAFILAELPKEAATWIARFLAQYEGSRAQLADACIMYLAEHEGIEVVFTLDRRDFSIYRTTKGTALHLIPEA